MKLYGSVPYFFLCLYVEKWLDQKHGTGRTCGWAVLAAASAVSGTLDWLLFSWIGAETTVGLQARGQARRLCKEKPLTRTATYMGTGHIILA